MRIRRNPECNEIWTRAAATPDRLARAIRRCLAWPTVNQDRRWRFGDYRFLVFDAGEEIGEAYAQFWSEPGEPMATMELKSGRVGLRFPPGGPHCRAAMRAVRRQLGMRLPHGYPNWRKEVPQGLGTDAHGLARDVLAGLALQGWREGAPLHMHAAHATRLEGGEVMRWTRPDRLAQMARGLGWQVTQVDDGGGTVRMVTTGGMTVLARLLEPVATPEAFTAETVEVVALPAGAVAPARLHLAAGVEPRVVQAFLRRFVMDAAALAGREFPFAPGSGFLPS